MVIVGASARLSAALLLGRKWLARTSIEIPKDEVDGRAALLDSMTPALGQLADEEEPSAGLHQVGRDSCLRLPLGPVVPNTDEQTLSSLFKLHDHVRFGATQGSAVQDRVGDDLAYQEFDVFKADGCLPGPELPKHAVPTRTHLARVRLETQHLKAAADFANLLNRYKRHLTSPPAHMQ